MSNTGIEPTPSSKSQLSGEEREQNSWFRPASWPTTQASETICAQHMARRVSMVVPGRKEDRITHKKRASTIRILYGFCWSCMVVLQMCQEIPKTKIPDHGGPEQAVSQLWDPTFRDFSVGSQQVWTLFQVSTMFDWPYAEERPSKNQTRRVLELPCAILGMRWKCLGCWLICWIWTPAVLGGHLIQALPISKPPDLRLQKPQKRVICEIGMHTADTELLRVSLCATEVISLKEKPISLCLFNVQTLTTWFQCSLLIPMSSLVMNQVCGGQACQSQKLPQTPQQVLQPKKKVP